MYVNNDDEHMLDVFFLEHPFQYHDKKSFVFPPVSNFYNPVI